MRSVSVNNNGPEAKGLAELNHNMWDEEKEARNGVAGDGHGLSEEDESRINEDAEDVNGGRIKLVQPQAVLQRQQQQPQGPVVRWDRFLPRRSLNVLLVENDDSTRHVVSALLRNCSYDVTAVANGLEAWKILEGLNNHIDLVLTEVVTPNLSGVGLLLKIVSHKTCRNIPVIMMSSNDSMGIVFKCLSKGAVDFLVKPIRKNELKNLWQHIWRKCHSSSNSGSESGIRTEKSTRPKSVEGSDNNSGSYDEDDSWSIGLNAKDGSDNGSGTQNSWSKRAVEVDSSLPMSSWDQLEDPPESTCAQFIHLSPEAFSNNRVPMTITTMDSHKKGDELDNLAMGKDLVIGVSTNPDLQLEDPSRKLLSVASTSKDKFIEEDGKKVEKERLDLNSETVNGELGNKAADLIGATTSNCNPQMKTIAIEVPNEASKIANIKDKAIYDTKDLPSLELSLKRLRDAGDVRTRAQERNVLRHSDLSAFSRYNTASNANQTPTGNVGSCSPADNSSEAAKTEPMHNLQSNSNGTPIQCSNGNSNDNDMGSTTNNVFTKPEAFSDKPMPRSTNHPGSAFRPVQHSHISSLHPEIPGKANAAAGNTLEQSTALQQQLQVQHHHHHYHHHHHHVHNMQQKHQIPNHDDFSLRNMDVSCCPSNMLTGEIEGNAANYSLNRSASGSNDRSNEGNGSSGQNGSNSTAIAEGTNMASDNGVAGKCGADDGSGSGSGRVVDQNRSAQREAALNKFRQKRKDRCFEKKVRYQSRKRLAEQRPRVRGQFVRQAVNDNENKDRKS